MVDRWIPWCIALCVTALPSLCGAQTDPDATTMDPTRVPAPDTTDPAIESRASRIALGTLVSIGAAGVTFGAPVLWSIPFMSSFGSAVPFTVLASIGGIATVALVPLAYVTAADSVNGRGKYWAALVGWSAGLALGSVFIALAATVPPTISPLAGVIGASAFMPVLGFIGQAVAYEASMPRWSPDRSPRARRPTRAPSWLPLVSATPQSLSLSAGGVF